MILQNLNIITFLIRITYLIHYQGDSMQERKYLILIISVMAYCYSAEYAHAMHIAEGFLPLKWSIIWYIISLPFVYLGLRNIQSIIDKKPKLKMYLVLAGAFAFVLSALKLPSVTGSSSHPTGVGLGAILFGPTPMAVLGSIVLLFQALLLAHGGITTLGANIFSMAIVGPFVAFGLYKLLKKINIPKSVAIFFAAFIGDLATYITTAIQLSIAFPSEIGGMQASLVKFLGIFGFTQLIPAIGEGLLTVLVLNLLSSYSSKEDLEELNLVNQE